MFLPRIARSYTGGESFVPSAVTPSSDCVLVKGCLRDNPIENHPNAATNIKTADKTALTIDFQRKLHLIARIDNLEFVFVFKFVQ